MNDLGIENLNKSTVILSNGLEMKKGDKINPYSYAEKLQETMIQMHGALYTARATDCRG